MQMKLFFSVVYITHPENYSLTLTAENKTPSIRLNSSLQFLFENIRNDKVQGGFRCC